MKRVEIGCIKNPAPGFAMSLIALGFAAGPSPAAADKAGPFTGELRVTADNLGEMFLVADGGQWAPVTASSSGSRDVNVGFVAQSAGSADHVQLKIHLARDSRFPAAALIDLDLKETAVGRYEGDSTVTADGATSTSPAEATVSPKRTEQRLAVAGADKHPHLIMRREDIPALRAKMKTPLGEALLAKTQGTKDMVELGLLYQATGNKQYADQALEIVKNMRDIDANSTAGTGEIGHCIVSVVLTYDLCYDAWPKEFCERLRRQVASRLPKRQRDLLFGHANYNPASNYYGPGFGSAAIASLILHGHQGPEPPRPAPPLCVRRADCLIPADRDYKPPVGVPVVDLETNALPSEWLFAGPLLPAEGEDPIDKLGGLAAARPTPGLQVSDGERTVAFKRLSHEEGKGYWEWLGNKVISVTAANDRTHYSVNFFYTVVRNTQPRLAVFENYTQWHDSSETFINGWPVEEGQVVRLEPGLYTILIKVVMGQTEPWGQELISPRFVPIQEDKAKEINDRISARYEEVQRQWETALAHWKRLGEQDLENLRMIMKGRHQMVRHYRAGIGDGGFQAEVATYGNIAAYYPLLYGVCHYNTFGRHASPWPDATHVMPRKFMQAWFGPGGKAVIMQLNNKSRFEPGWLGNYFPLVPEKWKPIILWGWNHVCGVSIKKAAEFNRVAADKILAPVERVRLATTFINYPVDMDPVHPQEAAPKTWTAPTFGLYVFRSGFEGKDECIAQVFTKSRTIGGWNHPNAGVFRLWGLGHPWTAEPIERSGYREEESVVLLPDEVMNEGACGHVTHYQAQPDGSGSLTVDLSDVYLAAKKPKKKEPDPILEADFDQLLKSKPAPGDLLGEGRKIEAPQRMREAVEWERIQQRNALRKTLPRLYDRWGQRNDVAYESQVDGWRTIAFDYSGVSGAPCLMVLVDSVRGGSAKDWIWQLPPERGFAVEIDGATVRLNRPDASLQMTFISPVGVRPVYKKDWVQTFLYKGGSKKGETINRYYDVISAESDATDVDYIVIATLQKGEPPKVTATGQRLGSVIRVGRQTVRVVDEKIVFGEG